MNYRIRLFAFLLLLIMSACSSTNTSASVEGIEVNLVSSGEILNLKSGLKLSSDNDVLTIVGVPAYFENFQILKSLGNDILKGTIEPNDDSILYVLSSGNSLDGDWTILPGNTVTYYVNENDASLLNMSIFFKVVKKESVVAIPEADDSFKVMILGKYISIN